MQLLVFGCRTSFSCIHWIFILIITGKAVLSRSVPNLACRSEHCNALCLCSDQWCNRFLCSLSCSYWADPCGCCHADGLIVQQPFSINVLAANDNTPNVRNTSSNATIYEPQLVAIVFFDCYQGNGVNSNPGSIGAYHTGLNGEGVNSNQFNNDGHNAYGVNYPVQQNGISSIYVSDDQYFSGEPFECLTIAFLCKTLVCCFDQKQVRSIYEFASTALLSDLAHLHKCSKSQLSECTVLSLISHDADPMV